MMTSAVQLRCRTPATRGSENPLEKRKVSELTVDLDRNRPIKLRNMLGRLYHGGDDRLAQPRALRGPADAYRTGLMTLFTLHLVPPQCTWFSAFGAEQPTDKRGHVDFGGRTINLFQR